MFKRKLHFFLVFVALIALGFAPVSNTMAQGGKKTYQEVIEKYDLKRVTEVPSGVTPLRVSNPDELENLIRDQLMVDEPDVHVDISEPASNKSSETPEAVAASYGTVTRSCSVQMNAAYFNTYGAIQVGYEGSFRWVENVQSTWTNLTGVTIGLTLNNANSYSYNKTSTSVSVAGSGVVNAYIIVEGGPVVWSQPVSCSFTYSVY